MAETFPLLATKISIPAVRTPVIRRPRLLDLITHGTRGPLTVVSGAAGAGKTLLLASWTAEDAAPGPVAWLTLDEHDDEPGTFWAYVVAALRRARVAMPEDIGEPIGARSLDHSFLVRLADSLATAPAPVVLVLDQFDVLGAPEIKHGVEFVLRNAGTMLRLVLVSREGAPLPLHGFELRGELTRIGGADLAFTPQEAEALMHQHGVRLSADGLADLLGHVGGWAAALRLSAVAMQRRAHPEQFVTALPTSDATLTGYLLDEVLAGQSEEVREFLLRTSVIDTVCGDLAEALTGRRDSQVVLAALQTGNVLTESLDEAPAWYRYHPLFRRLLRAELQKHRPELVGQLQVRAAEWFEQAGMTAEAVRAAAAAEDWQRATTVTVRQLAVGTLLAGRQGTTLAGTLDGLPAGEPGAMPAVVRAARAMARFDLDSCRSHVQIAAESADEVEEQDRAPLGASIAVIRAVLARAEGDVDAAEAAMADGERELALLAVPAARHPEMRALLLSSAGTAQLWAGRFQQAEETLRRGLAAAQAPGCEYPRLNVLGRLAGVEFRNGHLRRAARLGQDALALAEECGLPVVQRTGAGHVALAMVAVEWNDRAAARRHLADAERTAGAQHDPFVMTIVPLLRAWLHAGARDFRRAAAALAAVPADVAGRPLPAWLAGRVALTEAVVHLQQGRPDRAAAALDRVGEGGPERTVALAAVAVALGRRQRARDLLATVLDPDRPDVDASRVGAWLLTAHIALDERNRPAAEEALGRALTLARPEGYRRAFAAAGPWVRDLLRSAPQLAAEHRWLGHPLVDTTSAAAGSTTRDDPPAAVVERLTGREQTVLERLAQGMSTEDIAHDLYLSVNTVKTHQKSLYRKLAVARRNEAVRKARQLQLI